MRIVLFILTMVLFLGCVQQLSEKQVGAEMQNDKKLTIVKGNVLLTKDGAYVGNVVVTDSKIEEYVGKNVEISGYVHEVNGVTKNDRGEMMQGREGKYLVMNKINSIKIIIK